MSQRDEWPRCAPGFSAGRAASRAVRRAFDIAASAAALVCLSPLLGAIAIAVKLDSRGSVVFRQVRVGMGFRKFEIYKFRTMVAEAPARGPAITAGADPRITRVGHFLRRWKLDEIAQLVNVLKGDMSVVGPRPEVPEYVEKFRAEYREILTVRPGLTDPASLRFSDESDFLALSRDPEREYVAAVLPRKLEMSREYLRSRSLLSDLGVILRTVAKLL